MKLAMRQIAGAVLSAALAGVPLAAGAFGVAGVHESRDFRRLIARGERPEIAACMAAAMEYIHTDKQYDSLRWNDGDSDAAHMREKLEGASLVRRVRFTGELRVRNHSPFETWRTAEVFCEQRDEQAPQVRVTAVDR
jgi:hypothetical protein